MGSLIEVRVRDCACPDAPHPDGDIVYLRPKIGLEGGIAAQQALAKADGDVEVLTRLWLSLFVRYGATGWNLRDETGPCPSTSMPSSPTTPSRGPWPRRRRSCTATT
jgi:hypothetical protein